jgi:glycosyltransferase involved in cell wall biosynthesis
MNFHSKPSSKQPKRVLILSYLDYPMPVGISRRISGIAASLRASNFEVEIISPIFRWRRGSSSGGTRIDLRFLCALGSEKLLAKIVALLLFNLFAFVRILIARKQLWAVQYESVYSYPAAFLAKLFGSGCPCIADDVLISEHSRLATLQAVLLSAGTDLALSSTKASVFDLFSKTRTLHVPTGLNEQFALKRSLNFEKIRVAFVGALSYRANLFALNNLLSASIMLPNCEFLVVGGPIPDGILARDNVKLLGSLDDSSLLRVYREANVGILPFFGIPAMGPKVKVLDYLAASLLVISSSEGVEGYPKLEAWKHYVSARSVEELAKLLQEIPGKAELYARIAKEGHDFALLNYNWPNLLTKYVAFMEKLRLGKC